jgi:hypothetical protein
VINHANPSFSPPGEWLRLNRWGELGPGRPTQPQVVEGRGDALLSSVNHAVTRGYIYGAGAVTVMEMLRELKQRRRSPMSVYGLLLGLQACRSLAEGSTAHVYPASNCCIV